MTVLSALEKFQEMVERGYVTPAKLEPSRLREPSAYVSVPMTLAFSTTPVGVTSQKASKNAKLESFFKRNSKRKRRHRGVILL